MDVYLKITAGILIAAILGIVVSKQGKDISMLLTITACCMVMVSAVSFVQPLLDFCGRLARAAKIDDTLLRTLLKVVGIGLISQFAGLICVDAGNQSLSKVLQVLTTAVILCISVPILEEILLLIEKILGEL